MNKLIKFFLLIVLLAPVGIMAQEGTVTQSPNTDYPVLENKLKRSDKDLDNPKKNINPKTWLSRAELMMNIYDVNRKYIEGKPKLSTTFLMGKEKEIKTEEKDGDKYETYIYDRVNVIYKNGNYYNYVETKKIYDNPLPEAKKSLEKAQELDEAGKLDKKIKEAYTQLSLLFVHEGGRDYNFNSNKEGAYNNFVESLNIDAKPIMENKVDTSLMYNTGLIALQLNKYDESIKYFSEAIKYNYQEPVAYVFLKQAYLATGDTTKGVQILQDGFTKYPDCQDIVIELINYYLTTGKSDEALNYIKIGQEKDPSNISLVFAEGTLYDKEGKLDKAIETYNKTIAMDSNYFNGYYNKGVLYYNRGMQFYKDADKAGLDEYKKLQQEGDEQFKLARKPMEKCMAIIEAKDNPTADDKETLGTVYETLKAVYYRLQKFDPSYKEKFDAIKAKLEQ